MLTETEFFQGSGVEILDSAEVRDFILAEAGAITAGGGRDAIDCRIVDQAETGTGRIITSENGVKPTWVDAPKVIDTDRDGMPDWFEVMFSEHGFRVEHADDRLDYDGDGWTNIEEYLNGLITGFDFGE